MRAALIFFLAVALALMLLDVCQGETSLRSGGDEGESSRELSVFSKIKSTIQSKFSKSTGSGQQQRGFHLMGGWLPVWTRGTKDCNTFYANKKLIQASPAFVAGGFGSFVDFLPPNSKQCPTPVVFPFANPANNMKQCGWAGISTPSFKCGDQVATGGGLVAAQGAAGVYAANYLATYIQFQDDAANSQGSLYNGLWKGDVVGGKWKLSKLYWAISKAVGPGDGLVIYSKARTAIAAVMQDFIYNAIVQIITAQNPSMAGTLTRNRCGFPNAMTFGCSAEPKNKWVNNPTLSFAYNSATGGIRLGIQFAVDWNTIAQASGGSIKTFGSISRGCGENSYVCATQKFFSSANSARLNSLWMAALKRVCPSATGCPSSFLAGFILPSVAGANGPTKAPSAKGPKSSRLPTKTRSSAKTAPIRSAGAAKTVKTTRASSSARTQTRAKPAPASPRSRQPPAKTAPGRSPRRPPATRQAAVTLETEQTGVAADARLLEKEQAQEEEGVKRLLPAIAKPKPKVTGGGTVMVLKSASGK